MIENYILNKILSKYNLNKNNLLLYVLFVIHMADPQLRPVVIIVFAHVARPYVRPQFSKSSKTMLVTGDTVDMAEWIIDDPCLVFVIS